MRYTPIRFTKGTEVTAKGQAGKVVRHRTDALVEVKLPNGKVVLVESHDVKKKG
jgi:ribosomal protein L6P/L9E